jgi:hypothetical protein
MPICAPPVTVTLVRFTVVTVCRSMPAAQFVFVPFLSSPQVAAVPRFGGPVPRQVKLVKFDVVGIVEVHALLRVVAERPAAGDEQAVPTGVVDVDTLGDGAVAVTVRLTKFNPPVPM